MLLRIKGVSACQPLLPTSSRLFFRIDLPRRGFAALAKKTLSSSSGSGIRSDVIKASKWNGWRYGHNKGETSHDYPFLLLRWSKQVWSKMFGKYLVVTNILGSGVLMATGDIIAQQYELHSGLSDRNGYDGDRVYRMFVAGALQGPLHHYVYKWMDGVMPQRTFRNIANKILIDQLFMSPACILIFFYTVCYLERQTLKATNDELIAKFPYIYLLDWLTWPAAQYLNFRYLDAKYRVAFVNVCTAFYNVLISYMKHDFGIHLPIPHQSISTEHATSKDDISERSAVATTTAPGSVTAKSKT